jgi:hypothetical protein
VLWYCYGRLSEKNGGSQIGAQGVQHDPAHQAVEPSLFLAKLFGSIFLHIIWRFSGCNRVDEYENIELICHTAVILRDFITAEIQSRNKITLE